MISFIAIILRESYNYLGVFQKYIIVSKSVIFFTAQIETKENFVS